mmetsp:Transcript_5068/g.15367  ORF Transcript_5068/g.15367 Transcript_5068/m.15367 type:complete len:217 (-) Transcript_5068:33-683(-)
MVPVQYLLELDPACASNTSVWAQLHPLFGHHNNGCAGPVQVCRWCTTWRPFVMVTAVGAHMHPHGLAALLATTGTAILRLRLLPQRRCLTWRHAWCRAQVVAGRVRVDNRLSERCHKYGARLGARQEAEVERIQHVYPAAGVHDGACVLAKRMEHAARRQPAALVVRELHVCQLDGRGMAAGGPAKGVGEPRLKHAQAQADHRALKVCFQTLEIIR